MLENEIFLTCLFPRFCPSTEKYGLEKSRILAHFTQWRALTRVNQKHVSRSLGCFDQQRSGVKDHIKYIFKFYVQLFFFLPVLWWSNCTFYIYTFYINILLYIFYSHIYISIYMLIHIDIYVILKTWYHCSQVSWPQKISFLKNLIYFLFIIFLHLSIFTIYWISFFIFVL